MVKTVRLTIQPFVLSESDKSVLWRPLSVGLPRYISILVRKIVLCLLISFILRFVHKQRHTILLIFNTFSTYSGKGPSINDVLTFFDFFDPLPPICHILSHL